MTARSLESALVAITLLVPRLLQAQSAGPRPITLQAPNAKLAEEFTLVSAVRELSDGRVLVVDRSEKKLLVADLTRGSIVQLGRNGSGPGEYLQPSALLALDGDTTILPDSRNGRWLLLRGAQIIATVGPESPAIKGGARVPAGADSRGFVIFSTGIGMASREGGAAMPRRDSLQLLRVARATGRADSIAMLRARPSQIKVEGPIDRATSVEILVNPLAAGEAAAVFADGWIAIARLEPYRVDWIALDGKRIRGAPLPFERVRVDEREQRAFVERLAIRSGQEPRDIRSFPDWPEIMPPFQTEALLPAPDGRLWIRRTPTAEKPDPPYDVVDRQGVLVARVAAGKDVQVVGFGRAAVYTVATDDSGIQRLRRHPLPRFQGGM